MKIIVTSWFDIHTQTPYSIERVSTSAQDVMKYLKEDSSCFGDTIEFAEYFNELLENKLIDGVEYLQNKIDENTLGMCFARIYSSFFEKDEREYKYFMFQVRNLH